jgi:hypothetical protein
MPFEYVIRIEKTRGFFHSSLISSLFERSPSNPRHSPSRIRRDVLGTGQKLKMGDT